MFVASLLRMPVCTRTSNGQLIGLACSSAMPRAGAPRHYSSRKFDRSAIYAPYDQACGRDAPARSARRSRRSPDGDWDLPKHEQHSVANPPTGRVSHASYAGYGQGAQRREESSAWTSQSGYNDTRSQPSNGYYGGRSGAGTSYSGYYHPTLQPGWNQQVYYNNQWASTNLPWKSQTRAEDGDISFVGMEEPFSANPNELATRNQTRKEQKKKRGWSSPRTDSAKYSTTTWKPRKPTALPVPVPTERYLEVSLQPSVRLEKPSGLLIILDLNGTLLYRRSASRSSSRRPQCRPGLSKFLDFIFENFSVMVWTSAQPNNAMLMVDALFTNNQKEMLLGIWARDTLGLNEQQYRDKVLVYKKLERVWEGEFRILHPGGMLDGIGSAQWDQANTVLLDDSVHKAKSHPYNHMKVPEFSARPHEVQHDKTLHECIDYLEELKWQSNVSSYMRRNPFKAQYLPPE